MSLISKQPLDTATFYMEEVINELSDTLVNPSVTGSVADSLSFNQGNVFGIGYLLGTASDNVTMAAISPIHDESFERSIFAAIELLLTAVIIRRMDDSDCESDYTPPNIDDVEACIFGLAPRDSVTQ